MAQLAANTPRTPKTPKLSAAIGAMSLNTPRSQGRSARAETTKTPHQDRVKLRKGNLHLARIEWKNIFKFRSVPIAEVSKMVQEDETSDEDFSADEDSDYKADEQSAGSSSSSGAESAEDSDQGDASSSRRRNVKVARESVQPAPPAASARSARLQQRLGGTEDCVPQSDNYFSAQASKKV